MPALSAKKIATKAAVTVTAAVTAAMFLAAPAFASGTPGAAGTRQLTVNTSDPGNPGASGNPGIRDTPVNPADASCAAARRVLRLGAPAGTTRPPCAVQLSPASELARSLWNLGGTLLGGGAAQLASSALIGIPSFALDLTQALTRIL